MTVLSGFTRPADPIGADLAPRLQASIGKTVADATCSPTDIFVSGPALVAGDKPAIQTFLNGYVFDPMWFLNQQQKNLQNIIATLRTWATSAHTESAAWNAQTQAQRDTAMTTTFDRLGTFFDRFADLLQASGWGT